MIARISLFTSDPAATQGVEWGAHASRVRGLASRRANFLGATPRNRTRRVVCSPRIELQELPGRIYQRISSERVRPKVSKDRWNIADSRSQTCVVLSDDLWKSATGAESSATITSFARAKRARYGCRSSCQCATRRDLARGFFYNILPYSRRAKSSGGRYLRSAWP